MWIIIQSLFWKISVTKFRISLKKLSNWKIELEQHPKNIKLKGDHRDGFEKKEGCTNWTYLRIYRYWIWSMIHRSLGRCIYQRLISSCHIFWSGIHIGFFSCIIGIVNWCCVDILLWSCIGVVLLCLVDILLGWLVNILLWCLVGVFVWCWVCLCPLCVCWLWKNDIKS